MLPFSTITRRAFLQRSGVNLGTLALSDLLRQDVKADSHQKQYRGLAGLPHHTPKAKRVIFLYMSGGPSHLETFDPKPRLNELDGKPMPESFTRGQPIAQLQGKELKVQGAMTKFGQHGKSGQWISDFLPWHGKMADDITIIRSMVTDQINHDPAHTMMNTGTAISGRPSMGSWITYGLGSESQNLPGFIVLTSFAGRNPQPISQRMWGPGFLPSRFQGVEFSSVGDPVAYLSSARGTTVEQQKELVDTIARLDHHRNLHHHDPEVETRINAYELAFRMQTAVPELMDISKESAKTLEMYGAKPGDGSYASNCLLARRLAERGVRFIQLYHRDWDHHGDLVRFMNICCKATDQPTYALLQDLKQRGMLDDTLIIWGGEFGRTPMHQGKGGVGRDHHIKGFSIWMAGGGIKPGLSYGNTDELGYHASENPVHVRDLHATMLHLLGVDHSRLAVKYQGLDMKLTGVEPAHVVRDILL